MWDDLISYARRQHSQCGEEGIIDRIFQVIGETNRAAVEFGAGDGYTLSNTRGLVERGWTGYMFDLVATPHPVCPVHAERLSPDNVDEVFDRYGVPQEPDLMSVDVDGNDYWIWGRLRRRPRVVVLEFNPIHRPGVKVTVPYDPDFRHDGTDYYGASFEALVDAGRRKGYTPVGQLQNLNVFLVRSDLVQRAPVVTYTVSRGHPLDPLGRPWQAV